MYHCMTPYTFPFRNTRYRLRRASSPTLGWTFPKSLCWLGRLFRGSLIMNQTQLSAVALPMLRSLENKMAVFVNGSHIL